MRDSDEDRPRWSSATISDRIAAFNMLDQMTDATQAEKCVRLSLIGFGNNDIAEMLQTSPATVKQNLYAERRKTKKTAAPRSGSSGGARKAAKRLR